MERLSGLAAGLRPGAKVLLAQGLALALVLAMAVTPTAGLAQEPSDAGKACRLHQLTLPLHTVEQRPLATLKLNGTEVQMLVDSGAFYSMLSPATARQLNLPLRALPGRLRIRGLTGEIDAQRTVVEQVGLLGAILPNIEFLVGGNELGAGIDGILGRNVLAVADTEYDLAQGAVKLSFAKGACTDADFAHWAGNAPVMVVPLLTRHRARGDAQRLDALRVIVKVNGVRLVALLDTGAPSSSLSLSAARRAGIEPARMRPIGYTGGAGAGRARAWRAQVDLVEIADQQVLRDNQLSVIDVDSDDHDMLLGLDYFLAHRLYVARQTGQLYITWNGRPVFPSGSGQEGPLDLRQAALPAAPAPDDADALARRGAASLAAGKLEPALDDLNRAIALAPAAVHVFTRARIQLARRNLAAARADLEEALRLDPALDEARLWRVRSLMPQADGASRALADLAVLDQRLPPDSHFRLEMAGHLARLRRADEALRQYALWIDTHPQDARLPDALNARCLLRLREQRELPLAVKDCESAGDNDSALPAHRDHVGWAHLHAGNDQLALRRFERATRKDASAVALFGRGIAHQRLGNTDEAERDLQRARELDPQVEERLARLGLWRPAAAPGS